MLPHGYSCVAIKDVNDIEELSKKLAAIIADPQLIASVGRRGRKFAQDAQENVEFLQRIDLILERAARRERPTTSTSSTGGGQEDEISRFPFTRMAIKALASMRQQPCTVIPAGISNKEIDLEGAQKLLVEVKRAVRDGRINQLSLEQAIEAEIAIACAENNDCGLSDPGCDPLFRLHSARWAIGHLDFGTLVPIGYRQFRILRFDYDVSKFRGATTITDLPMDAGSHPSYIVVFHQQANRNPLIVDEMTSRFLELVDGRKTVTEILLQLDQHDVKSTSGKWAQWVEHLFVYGLIGLREVHIRA